VHGRIGYHRAQRAQYRSMMSYGDGLMTTWYGSSAAGGTGCRRSGRQSAGATAVRTRRSRLGPQRAQESGGVERAGPISMS